MYRQLGSPFLVGMLESSAKGTGGAVSVFAIVHTHMTPHKKLTDMSWDEVREAAFTDYITGIPNKRAYDESVKSGTQMHFECTSLNSNLDLFRSTNRDKVLPAFAQAVHEEDPDNVYYFDGVRFKAQADDFNQAQALVERINKRFADCVFTYVATGGQQVECRGLGFSYALGINEDDAMEAFRGRVTVTRRRRYVHKSPDCTAKIEGLHQLGYSLVGFYVPPKLKRF